MRKSGIIYPDPVNSLSIFGSVVIDEEIEFFEITRNQDIKKTAPELTQKVDIEKDISILNVSDEKIETFQSQSETSIQAMGESDNSLFSVSQNELNDKNNFQYRNSTWGMYQGYSQRQNPEIKRKFGFEKETNNSEEKPENRSLLAESRSEQKKDLDNNTKRGGLKVGETDPLDNSRYFETKNKKVFKRKLLKPKQTAKVKQELDKDRKDKTVIQSKDFKVKKEKESEGMVLGFFLIFEVFRWLLSTDIIVKFILGLIAGAVGFLLIFTRLGILGYFQ